MHNKGQELENIKKVLETEKKLTMLLRQFVIDYGTPCCDKEKTFMDSSCHGCNYCRVVKGELEEVREWIER